MYQKTIKILTEHVDCKQNLRLSTLLKFLHEVAIAHTEELGYPRTKTLDKGFLWVVAKQHVEVSRLPRYDETVTISTWPGQEIPFLFIRHYEIVSSSGESLVKASAVWTLIDAHSRTMINPTKEGIVIHEEPHGGEVPFQFATRAEGLPHLATIKASWRDCDLNGHMNNTAYLDEAEDLIPIDFLKKRDVKSFDVAYKKEIPLGTTVEVNYGETDGTYLFVSPYFFLRLVF